MRQPQLALRHWRARAGARAVQTAGSLYSPRMKIAAALIAVMMLAGCASTDVPAAGGDTIDVEATVLAVYNVVSGPAGRRDWDRFEELFAPGAELVAVGADGK